MNKRMLLMPLTTFNSKDNNKNAQILLFGATTEALQGPATTNRTTPTPGEISLNKIIRRVTILITKSKFVSSARSPITVRRSVERGSLPTNPVWTPMDARSGPRSMPLQITTRTSHRQHQSRLSRIFNTELDGTPTSSSTHHSADHYEFVCHFNCNL
jgi:hypothetical protein